MLGITLFRPFPIQQVRDALHNAKRVVVLENRLAVGLGGILSTNVRMALSALPIDVYTVVAGLGGRPITMRSLHALFRQAEKDEIDAVSFLDLNREAVDKQLARERAHRRTGPAAEAMLRDLGVVGAKLA
ncbi:MAG: hypothetical protein JNM82_00505 [Rhodocyclaceae bacterium]|nr:hypothetical protein [Rhodocyclaceae bacterium]